MRLFTFKKEPTFPKKEIEISDTQKATFEIRKSTGRSKEMCGTMHYTGDVVADVIHFYKDADDARPEYHLMNPASAQETLKDALDCLEAGYTRGEKGPLVARKNGGRSMTFILN